MHVIGILGGVASGKSAVARMFEQLGAIRLDADRAGHLVLERPQIQLALIDRWGNSIVGDDGQVDRRAIAAIVFGENNQAREELRFLERLTHPLIAECLQSQIETAATAGCRAAILDAAVMLKAGWDQLCSLLVFVDVPLEERLRRAASRGWTVHEFEAREAAQWPVVEKRRRADRIIDNSRTLGETFEQVQAVWLTLSVDPQ
jgi:dephospho-CoA kinase